MTPDTTTFMDLRVLYVEDEELLRIETQLMMEHRIKDFVCAADGEEAWKIFQQCEFDVVITDISMPKLNGVDLCRRIRNHHPKQRLIVTSSSNDNSALIELINLGIQRFMPKPLQYIRLFEYLEMVDHHLTQEKKINAYQNLLEEKNEELHCTIKHLQKTQKQLVETEKVLYLGQLLNGVAHEINTPIGICVSGISFLYENLLSIKHELTGVPINVEQLLSTLSQSIEAGDLIQSNLERAIQLIKAFKQLSVEQDSSATAEVDVKEFMLDLFEHFREKCNKNSCTLEAAVEIDQKATLSPDTYQTILNHLLDNALHHGQNSKDDFTVSIKVSVSNSIMEIEFKDNGKGIAKKDKERIFNPLFTTARKEGCIGLGLTIVYNLVRYKLGGSVELSSQVDQGFSVCLKWPIEIA